MTTRKKVVDFVGPFDVVFHSEYEQRVMGQVIWTIPAGTATQAKVIIDGSIITDSDGTWNADTWFVLREGEWAHLETLHHQLAEDGVHIDASAQPMKWLHVLGGLPEGVSDEQRWVDPDEGDYLDFADFLDQL